MTFIAVAIDVYTRDEIGPHALHPQGLTKQRRELSSIPGIEDSEKIMTVGRPEALVLLQIVNNNRYVHIVGGVHKYIDDHYQQGTEGWINDIKRFQPDMIFMGPTEPGKPKTALFNYLRSNFVRKEYGYWTVYHRTGNNDNISPLH
jgi:hypothetical protein